ERREPMLHHDHAVEGLVHRPPRDLQISDRVGRAGTARDDEPLGPHPGHQRAVEGYKLRDPGGGSAWFTGCGVRAPSFECAGSARPTRAPWRIARPSDARE